MKNALDFLCGVVCGISMIAIMAAAGWGMARRWRP